VKISIVFAEENIDYLNKEEYIITSYTEGNIQLEYVYIGEPNYDRVQLELKLYIDGQDILNETKINRLVELPFQYPPAFELLNPQKNIIAVLHTQGIYLIERDTLKCYLISYSNKYVESFFFKNGFYIIEEQNFSRFDLNTHETETFKINFETRSVIRAMKLIEEKIVLSVFNITHQKTELYISGNADFSRLNFKKYTLSDYVPDTEIEGRLRHKSDSRIASLQVFRYPNLIDSWLPLKNINNRLMGYVTIYENPIKDVDGNIFSTKYFDLIELKIQNER